LDIRSTRDYLQALDFKTLFNELGWNQPKSIRTESATTQNITYERRPHPIEKRWPNIQIPDKAFDKLFELFSGYSWNLDDTPGGQDDEISPHVLGYIFEKYINQKAFGAYYTRPEITEYLCEQTIHNLILAKVNELALPGSIRSRHFDSIEEMLMELDAPLCRDLLTILPKISILDPACGSGAFLVSAMNTLLKIYGAITGRINVLHDSYLTNWLQQAHTEHGSLGYYIKKKIITENLFGVDLMEEAMEIAKLRLFLALVSSAQTVEQLEPLPNIDFNILPGNSLIGFLQVNEERLAQLNLFQKSYQEVVAEKNRAIAQYKSMSRYTKNLQALRDDIQQLRESAITNLNELLLDDFKQLDIKYEQTIWDSEKQANGKTKKRATQLKDIEKLHPFHWDMEFKSDVDINNIEKMLTKPHLNEKPKETWNFSLTTEFHMTNDHYLFRTSADSDCKPLYEGKMMHQFSHRFSSPRYWININQGRNVLARQEMRRIEIALDTLASLEEDSKNLPKREQRVKKFLDKLGYSPLSPEDTYIAPDTPRLVFRDIARNTDERTLIATILPAGVFSGNTLNYATPWYFNVSNILKEPKNIKECYKLTFPSNILAYLCGMFNSFTLDYMLRFKVTTHANLFYVYQLPVPRLAADDPRCITIATHVARLVCIGPEFDDLRSELLGDVNAHVATESEERYKLRSEIDGLVAHLYGLTEQEFKHVLDTFPLVKAPVKDAALEAYRYFALDPDDLQLFELIARGETDAGEFKIAACWNARENRKNDEMKKNIVR
jgi:hypothetical protein